jgi:hypothetical protein
MDIRAEVTLLADEDLVERMARLEAMGVSVCELLPSPSPQTRTLALMSRENCILLACFVRLEPVDQVREMLEFYERAILNPEATRH